MTFGTDNLVYAWLFGEFDVVTSAESAALGAWETESESAAPHAKTQGSAKTPNLDRSVNNADRITLLPAKTQRLPMARFAVGIGLLVGPMLAGCGVGDFAALFGDGENRPFRAAGGKSNGQEPTTDSDASLPPGVPPKDPRVCVFDYDLTLSSHDCPETDGNSDYFCRVNTCDTYGWYPQCLAKNARTAVAECVRRHAYVGIASKADVDNCWADKVLPILSQNQFPELVQPPFEPEAGAPIVYPALDDRANWNCDDCAYTMDGALGKPEGIRRIMRHFGLDPSAPEDRARVIFWDDTATNIADVKAQMPETRAVLVPSNTGSGVDGGCGITRADIDAGWAP